MNTEKQTDDKLTIEIIEIEENIAIKWIGKSTNRKPGNFLTPILSNALTNGNDGKKEVILDFRELEYMNSSTISPIIKFLHNAKSGNHRILVKYKKLLKWQELNFSALNIFQTPDKRIQIIGE